MSSSSNGGCRDCYNSCSCQFCEHSLISCTPIDALPGYQDQQNLPLPPLPRERGRSRANNRGRQQQPQPHPQQIQVFCSPVILSTSTPAEHNGLNGYKWRPRRQRSASARQRQGASLIRPPMASNEAVIDNCPLCQPRYSKSPERLLRLRPSQSPASRGHHQPHQQPQQPHFDPRMRPKLSYGDLLSKRPPTSNQTVMLQKNKARLRRSKSEFRPQQPPQLNNDLNPLNLHPQHKRNSRDYNGNCHEPSNNSEYAELAEQKRASRASRSARKVSRSKSRGPHLSGPPISINGNNAGLLTVWPGKAGIWLPQ